MKAYVIFTFYDSCADVLRGLINCPQIEKIELFDLFRYER